MKLLVLALALCLLVGGVCAAQPMKLYGYSNGNQYVTTIGDNVQHPDGYVKITTVVGSTVKKIHVTTITTNDVPYSIKWYKPK